LEAKERKKESLLSFIIFVWLRSVSFAFFLFESKELNLIELKKGFFSSKALKVIPKSSQFASLVSNCFWKKRSSYSSLELFIENRIPKWLEPISLKTCQFSILLIIKLIAKVKSKTNSLFRFRRKKVAILSLLISLSSFSLSYLISLFTFGISFIKGFY
jgi:hypothetical protein